MGQKLASQCPHHSLVHPNFLRADRDLADSLGKYQIVSYTLLSEHIITM